MSEPISITDKIIVVVEVTRPESHGIEYKSISKLSSFSASAEFDGAEDGESITLTLRHMSKEEFDGLKDFPGW